ncbi:MAG: hypothetical protein WCP28_18135 [Actinomycetes bacterium]
MSAPTLLPAYTMLPAANGYPEIKVKKTGRRASLVSLRPDGTFGMHRPRTAEEVERSSVFQRVRAILADPGFWLLVEQLPGSERPVIAKRGRPTDQPTWVLFLMVTTTTQVGSQRAAVSFFGDPVMWMFISALADRYRPAEYRSANDKMPTRNNLNLFNKKWKSKAWAPYRDRAKDVAKEYALSEARKLGYFDPEQRLDYSAPDTRQWVTLDGTVYDAPSKRNREDGGRVDPASGWHSKSGKSVGSYGTKFSLVETITDEYNEQLLLSFAHVRPKKGKQQGDEAAASEELVRELKQRAPGLRGNMSDSAFRGPHIARLLGIGVVTVNHPTAKSNPNRKTEGRMGEDRVERKIKIRNIHHKRRNGQPCAHALHLVGSVPNQEVIDAEGNLQLAPVIAHGFKERRNRKSGTYRYYLVVRITCRHGNFEALIRLDKAARDDIQGQSRADLARLYPVGSPQFGFLYGRRNSSESIHAKMKRYMPTMPAYGALGQLLYVLGFMVANNALALAFVAKRLGQPNALDGTG